MTFPKSNGADYYVSAVAVDDAGNRGKMGNFVRIRVQPGKSEFSGKFYQILMVFIPFCRQFHAQERPHFLRRLGEGERVFDDRLLDRNLHHRRVVAVGRNLVHEETQVRLVN